jgi:hypothetical protein
MVLIVAPAERKVVAWLVRNLVSSGAALATTASRSPLADLVAVYRPGRFQGLVATPRLRR